MEKEKKQFEERLSKKDDELKIAKEELDKVDKNKEEKKSFSTIAIQWQNLLKRATKSKGKSAGKSYSTFMPIVFQTN